MTTAAPVLNEALPLLEQVDIWRVEATQRLNAQRRAEFGQFLTPAPISSFMASLFGSFHEEVRLLDAGAGAGALLGAAVLEALSRPRRPRTLFVTGYEIDPVLAGYLRQTIEALGAACQSQGATLKAELVEQDFITAAVEDIDVGLFRGGSAPSFTHAILNPPYRKLNSDSATRIALRRVGIETSNLYTAFVALAIQRLAPGGEMVAITPRSFCNGPYFRPFREFLLKETAIRTIHLFESRKVAFSDDNVLQENVIFHVVKSAKPGSVTVSLGGGSDPARSCVRSVPFSKIVRPGDRECFIHLVPDERGQEIADAFTRLPCRLGEIGLAVSTGKVVDFRVKEYLRKQPATGVGPLIYPSHFSDGRVQWPKEGKKPNGLLDSRATKDLWIASGTYVLVKRFSSKEERRRVVAAVFDPADVPGKRIAFENHLNVFHAAGAGVDPTLARGLAAFLNSTFVDTYFRQFNGHTQVNATDLRNLHYPSKTMLLRIGRRTSNSSLAQEDLDEIVEDVVGFHRDGRAAEKDGGSS